jgi:hypothetical protein
VTQDGAVALSTATVVPLYAVGAALLALWLLRRFSAFGPRTTVGAAAAFGLALLLEAGLPAATKLAEHGVGLPGALLFVVLPFLTLVFWSAGRVLHCLVALVAPHLK